MFKASQSGDSKYLRGYGDLYVSVYGGRTRMVGVLFGRGLTIDKAKQELNGVMLESLVVAEQLARVI